MFGAAGRANTGPGVINERWKTAGTLLGGQSGFRRLLAARRFPAGKGCRSQFRQVRPYDFEQLVL